MSDIDRRLCLATGTASGLGRALALGLARQGWRMVLLARDPIRGEAALAAVRQAGAPKTELLLCDLSDLSSIRRAAAELSSHHTHLHLLLNCAAVYRAKRERTADGLEAMFATNHLGPFLLTSLPSNTGMQLGAGR